MGEVDIYFEMAESEMVAVKNTGVESSKELPVLVEKKLSEYEGESYKDLSEYSESDNDEHGIAAEENLEVFNNDNYEEQIMDEDEVYPATDDSSGDEETQTENLVRRGEVDGVFSLRQLFTSKNDFRQCVIKYILKTKRNIVYDRWE